MRKINVNGKIYMARVYGEDQFEGKLTAAAEKAYNSMDNMTLYENIDITAKERYIYDVMGVFAVDWMTLNELCEYLENVNAILDSESAGIEQEEI